MAGEENHEEVNQSVSNRVLALFIAALAEDKDLAEIVPRMKATLIDTEILKEDALRKALFGEGSS
jgi:hypothetical protein